MARRMKSKIQPAVTRLTFTGTVEADEDKRFFIDLSQCASLVNRRFYRQGLHWAVSGFKMVARATTGSNPIFARVGIHSLPHSWVMSNAWEKGFRHWMKEIKETLDETGTQSIEGKFLDFKIYANDKHHEVGYDANMLPIDSAGNEATPGEWIPSLITIPNTTAPGSSVRYEVIAVGGNYPGASPVTTFDAVSLINGYANSRALPNLIDPNVPADVADVAGATPENWLGAMQNDGTTQDIGTIVESTIQDQPPYPYENDGVHGDTMYPGGQNQLSALEIVDEAIITQGTVGFPINQMFTGGTFPCGLIELKVDNFATGEGSANIDFDFYVDLVPGSHRGYLAESMTDM